MVKNSTIKAEMFIRIKIHKRKDRDKDLIMPIGTPGDLKDSTYNKIEAL